MSDDEPFKFAREVVRGFDEAIEMSDYSNSEQFFEKYQRYSREELWELLDSAPEEDQDLYMSAMLRLDGLGFLAAPTFEAAFCLGIAMQQTKVALAARGKRFSTYLDPGRALELAGARYSTRKQKNAERDRRIFDRWPAIEAELLVDRPHRKPTQTDIAEQVAIEVGLSADQIIRIYREQTKLENNRGV